jgi:hypothetical protein
MVFCRIILTRRGENVNTNRITFYLFKFLFLFREYSGYFLGRLGLWYIPRGDIPPQRQNTTEHARQDEPPPVFLSSTSTEKAQRKTPDTLPGLLSFNYSFSLSPTIA